MIKIEPQLYQSVYPDMTVDSYADNVSGFGKGAV